MTKAKLKVKDKGRLAKASDMDIFWFYLICVENRRYLSDDQHSQETDTNLQERQLSKASVVNCCFSFSNQI